MGIVDTINIRKTNNIKTITYTRKPPTTGRREV